MSQLLDLYHQVGPEQFSSAVCQFAPYFGTIEPRFTTLRAGYAEATVPFRREITNHLGTVHAIALCNAAELVAGTMTDASVPAGARWIPKGMTVQYLAKAKTGVRAVADGALIDWSRPGDHEVPVDIYDDEGGKVFTARITMNIKNG